MVSYRIALLPLFASTLLTGVSGASCACKYQGLVLPTTIYNGYPDKKPASCQTNLTGGGTCTKYPGMYKTMEGIKLYGSNCAAWDQMPGTPWHSYCPSSSTWSHPDYNWCQQPWCYVDSTCADGVASSVFKGSTVAHYSYLSCGAISDCYTNIAWNASFEWPATGCPYDPTAGKTYKVHKSGSCACLFQGAKLTSAIFDAYPAKDPAACTGASEAGDCKAWPGKYKTMAAIKYYGTTCASWDQIPGTPWFSYCPAGADWCHYDWNWCQQPWCYVAKACTTGVASTVFKGSEVAFYSYNTCFNSPDCYTNIAWKKNPTPPAACPFDSTDNGWATGKQCPNGWSAATANTTVAPGALVSGAKSANSVNIVEVTAVTMAVVMVNGLLKQ